MDMKEQQYFNEIQFYCRLNESYFHACLLSVQRFVLKTSTAKFMYPIYSVRLQFLTDFFSILQRSMLAYT